MNTPAILSYKLILMSLLLIGSTNFTKLFSQEVNRKTTTILINGEPMQVVLNDAEQFEIIKPNPNYMDGYEINKLPVNVASSQTPARKRYSKLTPDFNRIKNQNEQTTGDTELK